MESTMPDREVVRPHYPTLEFVVGAIADWINKYRQMNGLNDELARCGPEDVVQIAKDLGVSASELRELAAKGPDAADLLGKMLVALHVDPQALARTDPAVMRDLQRLCVVCNHKRRCQNEQTEGTAARNFRAFCPNAFTLDALFKQADQLRH
jgi:hypothetical protein